VKQSSAILKREKRHTKNLRPYPRIVLSQKGTFYEPHEQNLNEISGREEKQLRRFHKQRNLFQKADRTINGQRGKKIRIPFGPVALSKNCVEKETKKYRAVIEQHLFETDCTRKAERRENKSILINEGNGKKSESKTNAIVPKRDQQDRHLVTESDRGRWKPMMETTGD
jgi:hypothetical protein